MCAEEAATFPAFSSERVRLLCIIADAIVETYNVAIELMSSRKYSYKELDIQKPNGISIINYCGKIFAIVARSYIEGRIKRRGIGFNRNTLRVVMKELIDDKVNGIIIFESKDDLIKFFINLVKICNKDKINKNKNTIINKIKYKLRQQLGRLPSNTWFIIIDINELKSGLNSASAATLIIQHIKEESQYYERTDTLIKLLQDRGINVITLEDILVMCAIIRLIVSRPSH